MDNQSIQHTRWNCTYHIVFIPKYRRKIMYGANKKDLVEIIPKLCEMKGISLIEGKVCKDHVHMYVAIPPKLCVSEVVAYLKGKSALMFLTDTRNSDLNMRIDISGQEDITLLQSANVNEETIRQYIKEQEENDKLEDGMK